ncbi:methyltransferase [Brucella anthropi]|uniref:RraA family protein n=1 Tax=Brucella anthropi TaxID=529 RepID=UPI003986FC2E
MTLGFRILQRRRRVATAIADRFRDVPVACVSDVMNRMNSAGAELRPMHASGVLAGVAFTVRVRPGDNLMIHKALLMAGPGDVIVVDAGGDLTNALIGEMMLTYARAIGVTGVVINGAVRDYGWIKAGTYPVFAAGVTHRGPYKDGPGEINVPISIGGMVIEPGDLILGDDDGLICVPFDQVEQVYAKAKAKNEAEMKTVANTLSGKLDPKSWVDESLRELGCEGV